MSPTELRHVNSDPPNTGTAHRLPDPHLTHHVRLFHIAHHDGLQQTQHVVVCSHPPQGRLRRAKPSSPAQHHFKKLYLHRTPLCARGTRSFSTSASAHTSLYCGNTPVSCDVHGDPSHPDVQFQAAAQRRNPRTCRHCTVNTRS